jgi:hypothetical protein
MSTASHQTIRLSRGSHAGPAQGACVMELASMLAGEPFTDHPECASPVLGSFLRAYNDHVAAGRRQDLYRYAAVVVGTRAAGEVEQARAELCAHWIQEALAGERRFGRLRLRVAAERRRVDGLTPPGIGRAAGRLAAMLARRDGAPAHARVLALLDRLVATPGGPMLAVGARARHSARLTAWT